jgi:hypothetical protein
MATRVPLTLCAMLLVLGGFARAQERQTEHTFKRSAAAERPRATLADMKWLEGRWVGAAFGGKTEEQWSAPDGGAMVGWYRLVKDGKPVFYELMTVVEKDGSLVMRLKHFHADLKGWEEKDEVREFALVAKEEGAMHFEGMSFHPKGDALTVYLAIEHEDGKVTEEKFEYARR